MEQNLDHRVIKTRRAIRNALAILLSEKDLNDITVKDLADAAEINRKTFYNNYAGIHEVVDSIENEIVSAFSRTMDGIRPDQYQQLPYVMFEKLADVINSDLDFYGALFGSDRGFSIIAKAAHLLTVNDCDRVAAVTGLSPEDSYLVLCYGTSGLLAVYRWWFNSDRTLSIRKIAETMSIMSFRGLNGLVEERTGRKKEE